MTSRTALLSGIAGLAVATVLSFGAQAQTGATRPPTRLALSLPSQMMSSGNAREPAAKYTIRHFRHTARSGPQDSTPAEQAATDRLNMQQLRAARN